MRNPFVADAISSFGLAQPDIDVPARPYFAQCAEDVIVLALLRSVADREGLDLTAERYLEIGANHPIATSATYLLHVEQGMNGVLVEANPKLIDALRQARPADTIVNRAIHVSDAPTAELFVSNQNELTSLSREFVETWRDGVVGLRSVETVPACRMNALIEEFFGESAPIYMSVDVESLDLELLKDLDWSRWRPAVVQAEPSEHFIKGNADMIADLMQSLDYIAVARTDVNQIFIDRGRTFLKPDEPPPPPPPPPRSAWQRLLDRLAG